MQAELSVPHLLSCFPLFISIQHLVFPCLFALRSSLHFTIFCCPDFVHFGHHYNSPSRFSLILCILL
jgi:hypothetical protein